MRKDKKVVLILLIFMTVVILMTTGCEKDIENKKESKKYSDLIDYKDALQILKEDDEATVLDIKSGITFKVKRVTGGFNTLADVETLSKYDTEKLLDAIGGNFSIIRRPVIVTVGNKKIAASIAPFEHSGREDKPYGEIIDNRSGSTGTGINLDSIRENGLIGVIDIYFYNSLTPGINRVDERHQEMVLEAYDYKG